MKINEAAEQAGMTAKNIRFYEQEQLLTPARQRGNGYRDYSEQDIETLKKIRLLRMLDLPIAEIRAVLENRQSLSTALERQKVLLADRSRSLEAVRELCVELAGNGLTLAELPAQDYLTQAAEQQRKGVRFVDIEKKDRNRRRYLGALLGAGVFILLMLAALYLEVWGFMADPAGAPPLPLLAVLMLLPVAAIAGVLAALFSRFKEIEGGEEDAYRNY